MRAKVKASYRWPTLIAFNGIEFNKKEFALVPQAFEKEAARHPNLELDVDVKPEEQAIAVKLPTNAEEPVLLAEEVEVETKSPYSTRRNKKSEE